MKTYRKRFMASTLALLMTVSIPLTALAEEDTGTENNGIEISQELNGLPVSDPAEAPTDPSTGDELEKAKEALNKAINDAKDYQNTDDYKKSELSKEKKDLEGDIHAAENVKDALGEKPPTASVDDANRVANKLNSTLKNLKDEIKKEKDNKDALDKAKKELKKAIDDATTFKSNEKYTKGKAEYVTAFDQALKDAKTAKDEPGASVASLTDAKNTLTAAQKKLEEATLPIASTLAISEQKVSSNGYVSGYVKADGVAVPDVIVSFYTNDGVFVANGKTYANGYFEFYVGTEYYNYYYDGYYDGYYKGHYVYYDSTYGYYYKNSNNERVYINDYYWYGKDYRCGKSGYLLAEKLLYTTSEKAYVKGTCDYNNYYWPGSYDKKYYDYRVYPTSVSRTTSYVKGYLPNEKGRTVSVYSDDYYYDGYYSDGYYDYYGYYNRYYRSSKYYLGSATVDSDGYFTIYFNRSVPTSESLYYYVDGYKDGRYATVPSVSQAEAGTMFIKGKAGSFASIRVEDANGKKIGTTTANGDGEFSCYLDRKLSLGETIKVIASESSKYDSETTYKVTDTSLSGQTYARVSYIKGYPDGTFKPSNNVTRAEAAQMFATLLNGGTSFGTSSTTKFADANNKWYSPAVNYIAGKGLLSGYSDGTFKPDADITRAEFAQMISGYLKAGYAGSANFKDVKGHWASDAIDKVFGNKAVEGYPDGTFKPNKTLTRAEAVTVLNAVFNRYTTSNSFKNVSSANLKNYSDISSSHWAYYQILDASNAHVSQKVTSTSNEEVWK
ncbi:MULTISPECIES: S-layer homology domain-containing protein [Peptoniphilus]|uniref:S-layer homology domain-containing protein n=1 Tax=Peptoniphilus TaxID=162289 RepID=UPI0001DCACCA|nr:S-layer homology domain-containing protein [Peptoniphilus sp. oral taxon 836]EFK38811.1 hypothetical protein HMPREF9131_0672 [Peptoniphilus sp. oral taxon 836 str. F0141]